MTNKTWDKILKDIWGNCIRPKIEELREGGNLINAEKAKVRNTPLRGNYNS